MSFKVVRNQLGEAICYGPNDDNYEPGIPAGCVLRVEETVPPPSKDALNAPIKALLAALDVKRVRSVAEGDTVYLTKLNEQAVALRAKLIK